MATAAATGSVPDANFSDALRQFEAAVGKEWVFSSDDDVDLYRDAYSPFWHEDEERNPSAAVAPDTVEQVQQIVQHRRKYQIPLWTISTGQEPRLRRIGSECHRQRCSRSQADEPRSWRSTRRTTTPSSNQASATSISTATFRRRA